MVPLEGGSNHAHCNGKYSQELLLTKQYYMQTYYMQRLAIQNSLKYTKTFQDWVAQASINS